MDKDNKNLDNELENNEVEESETSVDTGTSIEG